MTCWASIDYYEPAVNYALRKLIQPGMTVFDVGANEGILSVVSSRATGPSGKVIAFEGSPRTIPNLYKNLSDNHAVNVQVVNSYVSDKHNGVVPVYYRAADTSVADSMIGHEEEASHANAWVKSIRLDQFIQETGLNPDVIKVDVEGAELLVMQSLERYLTGGNRPLIILEVLGQCPSYEFLRAYGYISLDIHALRPMEQKDFVNYTGNVLFYQESISCPLPVFGAENQVVTCGNEAFTIQRSQNKRILKKKKSVTTASTTITLPSLGDYLVSIVSEAEIDSAQVVNFSISIADRLVSLHVLAWKDLVTHFSDHPIHLGISTSISISLQNIPTTDFKIIFRELSF